MGSRARKSEAKTKRNEKQNSSTPKSHMLSALAGPLLSCSLRRARPSLLTAGLLAQRTLSAIASSSGALRETTAKNSLPLLLLKSAFVSSPMLQHHLSTPASRWCFSLSSQRHTISMPSALEAARQKEPARRSAYLAWRP